MSMSYILIGSGAAVVLAAGSIKTLFRQRREQNELARLKRVGQISRLLESAPSRRIRYVDIRFPDTQK